MTNREIKFNIFDKLQERMWLWDEVGAELLNAALQGSERYLPLQWTGLKDSAGVEIYEGDFIEFWAYNQKHDEVDTGIALITWSEFQYAYEADLSVCKQRKNRKNLNSKILNDILDSKDLTGRTEISRRDLGRLGSIKIRGNIYQHPNLLNNQPK